MQSGTHWSLATTFSKPNSPACWRSLTKAKLQANQYPGSPPSSAAHYLTSRCTMRLAKRLAKRPTTPTPPSISAVTLANSSSRPPGSNVQFDGRFPAEFLDADPPTTLPAWHLVGGLDPLDESELSGNEPDDGYPVLLADWIRTDGLTCLKIKLRGNDAEWDYDRLVKVGTIAVENGVLWLTADFNCTVTDPVYVNEILDRLVAEHPRLYGMILYVEQPFPYELKTNRIYVHSVSARKPLFLDESAHDWQLIRLGRELGWTGVALKTCKTQTGAILSACWPRPTG